MVQSRNGDALTTRPAIISSSSVQNPSPNIGNIQQATQTDYRDFLKDLFQQHANTTSILFQQQSNKNNQ